MSANPQQPLNRAGLLRTHLLFWIFSRFSLIFSFIVAFSCCRRWNSDFIILASLSSSRLRFRMSWVLSCRISSSTRLSSSAASFISASPSPDGLPPPLPASSLSSFLSLSSRSRRSRSSSSSRVDMAVVAYHGCERKPRMCVLYAGERTDADSDAGRKEWTLGTVTRKAQSRARWLRRRSVWMEVGTASRNAVNGS